MKAKLAVIAPHIGAVSETFVRRHMLDLLPGNTVIITQVSNGLSGNSWGVDVPLLDLSEWEHKLPLRAAIRLGYSKERLRRRLVRNFFIKHNVRRVLGEYLDSLLEFLPVLNSMSIPYVVQGHGIDVSVALQSEKNRTSYLQYMSALSVLTRCEFHRKRLVDLGLRSEKVWVNPGGVDLPKEFPCRPVGSSKKLLAIGRMTPKKGPFFLLEAFRLALALDSSLHLTYVGGGEWYGAIRQFISACGLGDKVSLPGRISELHKEMLFRECGIFVQHSVTDPDTGDEEGLPAAIQEALAHGMPVIATSHSGIPEIIHHEKNGLLVKEGDSIGMSNAIFNLSQDSSRCLEMGLEGYKDIKNAYTWQHEKERLLHHLQISSV